MVVKNSRKISRLVLISVFSGGSNGNLNDWWFHIWPYIFCQKFGTCSLTDFCHFMFAGPTHWIFLLQLSFTWYFHLSFITAPSPLNCLVKCMEEHYPLNQCDGVLFFQLFVFHMTGWAILILYWPPDKQKPQVFRPQVRSIKNSWPWYGDTWVPGMCPLWL